MTFRELIAYLGAHSKHEMLDGEVATTLEKARSGAHRNPLAGQIVAALYEKTGLIDLEAPLERANAINALGPIRLAYMRDDAPVEGFRLVEEVVYLIDGAFNEEAQRLGQS